MSIAVCEKPAYPISKHLSINEIDEVTEMNFGRRCMGSQCAAIPFVPVRTCGSLSSAPEEWGVVTSKMVVQHRSFKEQAPEFFWYPRSSVARDRRWDQWIASTPVIPRLLSGDAPGPCEACRCPAKARSFYWARLVRQAEE